MDETYAEDSFVVGSEVEELASSDEEAGEVELMPEVSFVDGKRQYATRRRVFLHKASAAAAKDKPKQKAGKKKKPGRVRRLKDSSEEESEVHDNCPAAERGFSAPLWPKEGQAGVSRPKLDQRGSNPCAVSSEVSLVAKSKRVPENQQKQR